ncbi:Phage integrase family protein [Aliiroseovarius halocynthiae]|uniref:Tyrosine-type recombinase/integrase n=1 Tax=Aliiroseovarius halocynthiae TaxID=985055 RepID=A0A545SMC6_9RHOB|nr:tyrosine-type recombinase/integrase [Aliiroseovarius halocynthiae]TQV66006.1 tyrosine-type recombinase/integrase [Aliiroseovarius halocynthiae]SMR83291.1 Phage integrase family protein [Aliiroseovarius halocynthiae]
MAITMKLNHVDELSGGRKRFRRRFPKDVVPIVGKTFLQVAMKAREGSALVQEHHALMAEFDKQVSIARGETLLTPREQFLVDVEEAKTLLSGVTGLNDQYDEQLGVWVDGGKAEVLAEALLASGARSSLIQAVANPQQLPPAHTLEDARLLYLKERIGDDRPKSVRLDRVCGYMADTFGPLKDFALLDLKREHARSLRDAMLSMLKKDGTPRAVSSVKRELNMVRAMVGIGSREFDLSDKMGNPFEKLDMPKATQTLEARDERDPLPVDLIKAMRGCLERSCKSRELLRIWNLLSGTGCRMAEITGLLVDEVILDHEVPHLVIRPNSVRSLKTRSSVRKVPLVGLALDTAQEAVRESHSADEATPLFHTYAKPRGADGASQALMKHLRKVTTNPRHTNHSLRHSMKDWLREAGVPTLEQNLILGHTLGGEGDTAYGGELAKLRVTHKALLKVSDLGLLA